MNVFAKLLVTASYLLTAFGVAFWGFIIFRITKYPENYMGFSPMPGVFIFIALLVVAFVNVRRDEQRNQLILAVFAIFSCITLWAFDYFNILIGYESWLAKGMPDRPL